MACEQELADLRACQARYNQALQDFDRAIRGQGTQSVANALAIVLAEHENYIEARNRWAQCSANQPKKAAAAQALQTHADALAQELAAIQQIVPA